MPSLHPYVVRQGDHLRSIAAENGFDADTVWNDPANAELKTLRKTYNLLLPCDVIQIPDRTPASFALKIGATNTFTAPVETCKINHTFFRGDDPLTNVKYSVQGSTDDDTPKQTDGNGTATFEVPVTADAVRITFEEGSTYTLKVGHLDPVATPSGAAERLMQLGYLDEGDDMNDDDGPVDRDACVGVALAAFQTEHRLPATGTLDAATAEKLAAVFGC